MSDFLFYTSLLNPGDLATMVALAAIMLVFNGNKEATLREAWHVMFAAMITVAAWAAFSKGVGLPPLVRYAGMYVIYGVALFLHESFSAAGSAVGAGVLLVSNVGCTHLMK
jgi:hypothetical protein